MFQVTYTVHYSGYVHGAANQTSLYSVLLATKQVS